MTITRMPRDSAGEVLFHRWMAAQYLYLREAQGMNEAAAKAIIRKLWDVNGADISKAVKSHKEDARALVAAAPDAFSLRSEDRPEETVIEQMAKTFGSLRDAKAEASGTPGAQEVTAQAPKRPRRASMRNDSPGLPDTAEISAKNADFHKRRAREHQRLLERLTGKYKDYQAHQIMQAAGVIQDAVTLGRPLLEAAVSGLEAYERLRNERQTLYAARKKRSTGSQSLSAVREMAERLLVTDPAIKQDDAAQQISEKLHLSYDRTLKLLKSTKMFLARRSRPKTPK